MLSFGVGAICLVAYGGDDLSLAPREGVLLLNNDEVVAGTITAAGDRYDVVRKDVEIRIKRSEVAIVCRNLGECYLHKRSGIEQGRVQDHLALAEWCLKNGLVEQAEKEIANARAADPGHPRLRLLEPRLQLAKEAPRTLPPAPKSEKSSANELDAVVRNLPAGSIAQFTNGIQPMLLNYCGKSGCHGPRSTGALRLERIPPNRLAGRHATQGNLQAVLAQLDRDAPQDSKLLQAPIRPHGSLKTPIFTDRDSLRYKQLVEWVYLVSNVKPAAEQPTLEERAAPLRQNVPRPSQAPDETGRRDKRPTVDAPQLDPADWSDSFPDQPKTDLGKAAGARRTGNMADPGAGGKQTADHGEFVPKDPFDPEIFNRRFFGSE